MLEVVSIKPDGSQSLVVTVAGDSEEETRSMAARQMAIAHATPRIGPCGFSHFENVGYKNPPDAENPDGKVLSEQEWVTPGARRPGGQHLRECVIKARL